LFSKYSNDRRIQNFYEKSLNNPHCGYFWQSNSIDNLFIYNVCKKSKKRNIIVLSDREEALQMLNDFKIVHSEYPYLFIDSAFEIKNKSISILKPKISDRSVQIDQFLKREEIIAVTYPEALYEKMASQQRFLKSYKKGEILDIPKFIALCDEMGFERVPFVYEFGQYAIRGNILDVYSYSNALPYRIELFDNEIEEIRCFDIEDQLSVSFHDHFILSSSYLKNKETSFVPVWESFPTDTRFWIKDSEKLKTKMEQLHLFFNEKRMDSSDDVIPANYFIEPNAVDELFSHKSFISIDSIKKSNVEYLNETISEPSPVIQKNFNKLCQEIEKYQSDGFVVTLMCEDEKQFDRYDVIFKDLSKNITYVKHLGEFSFGFVDFEQKLIFFTSHEIFQRFKKNDFSKSSNQSAQAILIKNIKELKPGDFVTHIDHGVGKFSGLEQLEINGNIQEAVRLIYQNNDILYVHINSLYKISKYVGKEGTEPKLNKIGGDSWQAIKRKTKKRIKDIAEDLIKLYAKRKSSKGFAFSADTYMQYELEESFIYEDTPDQAKATLEVKQDMEKMIPMDRLVCGDVGFGKTEIAIRAAFKAVADSKQVAVLVPTTILALQHYRTFSERLKDFPCRIEFINRFKTQKQKTEIFKNLESGKIDILIGTHAIVGSKVKFKDLGLLIIDEEQKFGVAVKEKLKEVKLNVDTLTLTATPIPRTLQFSLLGARDYSLIQTPPPNRIPVYTEIAQFEPDFIKEIIENEVFRGGQVFFINNRIKELEQLMSILKPLMPNIDMVLAHGQMEGDKLENIIVDFMEKKYDVLFSTNIIESGIDIPNANTIIINNAHQFGMSDLHQMRGRVGRSNKKAYCYLLCPNVHSLTNESKQRLRAIEQNSDLGSGFQIAMRDLDLRGAGNLLGGEQSGFISDIGYDTFMKILDETITELKENDYRDLYDLDINQINYAKDCVIETDYDLYIPDKYISQSQERISIYTELNILKNEEELEAFLKKLKDRFGKLPSQIFEICNALRLKWIASPLGIERIILKNNKMRCYLIQNKDSLYYKSETFGKILEHVSKIPFGCSIKHTSEYLIIEFLDIKNSEAAKNALSKIKL
jgi:transcription-repair coupling factor (superfamily II helicase)